MGSTSPQFEFVVASLGIWQEGQVAGPFGRYGVEDDG